MEQSITALHIHSVIASTHFRAIISSGIFHLIKVRNIQLQEFMFHRPRLDKIMTGYNLKCSATGLVVSRSDCCAGGRRFDPYEGQMYVCCVGMGVSMMIIL